MFKLKYDLNILSNKTFLSDYSQFLDSCVSHGNAAMHLRCGGYCDDHVISLDVYC